MGISRKVTDPKVNGSILMLPQVSLGARRGAQTGLRRASDVLLGYQEIPSHLLPPLQG